MTLSALRFFWPRKLASQLILVTSVAVLVSSIAVTVWFEMSRERMSESAFAERMVDRAASAASLLGSISPDQRDNALTVLRSRGWRYRLEHGLSQPVTMNEEEQNLARHARDALGAEPAGAVTVKHLAPDTTTGLPPNSRRGRPALSITLPVDDQTRLITTIFRPAPPRWPMETIFAALAAILLTSIAAAIIARRVTRPLSKLSEAAMAVAQGGPAPHVPEVGPQDVRNAASAFNIMTDQVTRTMESQRQLLSAVGHDLRTPITAMRINIEFVSDNDLRDRLERNLAELQDLTEAVLSAARGTGSGPKRVVDLDALLDSLCTDMSEMDDRIIWSPGHPAPFLCRPNEIRRAVRNLIENALAYGHSANVNLEDKGTTYCLTVEDNGPGIAESDQYRVFEPFVRLEESRSSETGGSGLGLTLVKSIVSGHDGKISLNNRPEGGLKVTIEFNKTKS